MKRSTLRPRVHLFVCTHARRGDDPLRSGCGAAGPGVFSALKRRTLAGGLASRVWITSTGCLGHCPPAGCTVTVHPSNVHLVEVTEADVDVILRDELTP